MSRMLSTQGRRAVTTIIGAAALLAAPFMAAPASSEDGSAPTGPLADEMTQLLQLQPGGVQVSDNALAWDSGATVVVFPSPGESTAPDGLGENVRTEVIERMASETLAEQAQAGSDPTSEERAATSDFSAAGSYTSCPWSYYCFYTGSNFDGARYQFSSTCSGYPSNWGFNNQTTSWANRGGSGKSIYALNYNGGPQLWYEPQGYYDSYVGSSDNNRMSYWTCTYS